MAKKYPYRIFYAGTFWDASQLKGYAILDAVDSIGNTVKLIRGRVIVTALHPSLVATFKITDDGRIVQRTTVRPETLSAWHKAHGGKS